MPGVVEFGTLVQDMGPVYVPENLRSKMTPSTFSATSPRLAPESVMKALRLACTIIEFGQTATSFQARRSAAAFYRHDNDKMEAKKVRITSTAEDAGVLIK